MNSYNDLHPTVRMSFCAYVFQFYHCSNRTYFGDSKTSQKRFYRVFEVFVSSYFVLIFWRYIRGVQKLY